MGAMVRKLSIAIAVLVLAGCASVFGPVENPSVTIKSLRFLPAEGGMQRIDVTLRVMNPNGFPLESKGLVLEAVFNDIPLLNGAVAEPPAVPAYGEADMNVTLSASLLNGIRLLGVVMKHPEDALQYRLEARIDLSRPIARTLTILEQGQISARPPASGN